MGLFLVHFSLLKKMLVNIHNLVLINRIGTKEKSNKKNLFFGREAVPSRVNRAMAYQSHSFFGHCWLFRSSVPFARHVGA